MSQPNPLVEDQPRAEQKRRAAERITMSHRVEFNEPPDAEAMTAAGAVTDAAPVTLQDEPCPPGQHRMPDGTCMLDSEMPGMADDTMPEPAPVPGVEYFHTVVTEGVSTGMREFAPGSLTWRQPPFAFHWEYSAAAHGGQMLVAQVGLVTRVERDGDDIHFYGSLDLDSERGMEYARQLVAGWARWSSVGLDEQPAELEMIWPDGEEPEDPMEQLFAEPERFIIRSGNIGEVTAVSMPALADATVEPTQLLVDTMRDLGVVTAAGAVTDFAAVAPHSTPTTDEPWDAETNRARLPSPLPVDVARAAVAWIDDERVEDGDVPKDAAVFIHHEVSEAGRPGAANLTACSNTVAVLNGGRGVDVSDQPWSGDRQAIWEHVARHLRDADREPPPLQTTNAGATALTAAAHTVAIPDVPPAWWFEEPTDVEVDGALTITDEGRIYGRLAPAGVRHRAYRDKAVYVPMGNVDYGRWMNKQAIVDFGNGKIGRIHAGVITGDCGHCPPWATSDTAERMQHYDNSCSVFAKARIGEWGSGPNKGVWIAGAVEPFVTGDQVSRALGCDLSGDWGPHPERRGWQELTAALLVPVAGFTQARSGPSVTVRDGALVASAVPVRLAHTRGTRQPVPGGRSMLEKLARTIGRDATTRMQTLRDRLTGTEG